MNKFNKERGFIGTIFLIIIGFAALKYFFNWSIFDAAASEEGRGTVSYIRQILDFLWSILAVPVKFIWTEVVWPLISLAVNSLKNN